MGKYDILYGWCGIVDKLFTCGPGYHFAYLYSYQDACLHHFF